MASHTSYCKLQVPSVLNGIIDTSQVDTERSPCRARNSAIVGALLCLLPLLGTSMVAKLNAQSSISV
jgi:hypothetical protein